MGQLLAGQVIKLLSLGSVCEEELRHCAVLCVAKQLPVRECVMGRMVHGSVVIGMDQPVFSLCEVFLG